MQIRVLNPPREAKKLVVLDIDYTLFDHRSPAENPHELMRPCKFVAYITYLFCYFPPFFNECTFVVADLHEFLTAAYSEYDIIIWSATR